MKTTGKHLGIGTAVLALAALATAACRWYGKKKKEKENNDEEASAECEEGEPTPTIEMHMLPIDVVTPQIDNDRVPNAVAITVTLPVEVFPYDPADTDSIEYARVSAQHKLKQMMKNRGLDEGSADKNPKES